MYEVSVEETFAAGHSLRGYRGKCENIHGHNYRLRVVVEGEQVDSIGLLVDFSDLKRIMREAIEKLDHQFLNEVPPFDKVNPSAENMAHYFYKEITRELKGGSRENPVRVAEVKIWETDTAIATYRLP